MSSLLTTARDELQPAQEEGRDPLFPDDFDVMSGYRDYYKMDFPQVLFGGECWDARKAPNRPAHLKDVAFRYTWPVLISGRWQPVCKELLAALFNPNYPGLQAVVARRSRPLPFSSTRSRIASWTAWLRWLERHGVTDLLQVTQSHCDRYLEENKERMTAQSCAGDLIIPVRDFAVYQRVLRESYPVGFQPWGRRSASKVAGRKPMGQNKTPWIPDEVLHPLLASALFMVEQAAPDLRRARTEYSITAGLACSRTPQTIDQELPKLLQRYEEEGLKLPPARVVPAGADQLRQINLHWLGQSAGLRLGREGLTLAQQALILEAAEKLGVGDARPLFTHPSMISLEDGREQPWRIAFSAEQLQADLKRLVSACFILITALSGLRPSETLELERGCVQSLKDEDEHTRYRLHSRVIKGRRYGGERESWIVIKTVGEAVRCMESLVPEGEGQKLFVPHAICKEIGKPSRAILPLREMLKEFVASQPEWADQAGLPAIPLVNGQPWHLKPSQFRRTLARQLAYRPHGTLASKIYLKHVSATITEGYWGPAGESAELFLKEVEEQEQEARLQRLQEQFSQWREGQQLAGGGSRKLAQDFATVHADMEAFSGTVEQSERRLRLLLRQRAGTLHIGLLNDCHFTDPSKARCLKSRGISDADKPLLPACEPSRCANAVITQDHAPRWEQPLIQITILLADSKIPRHERERLGHERERLQAIIQPLQGDSHE